VIREDLDELLSAEGRDEIGDVGEGLVVGCEDGYVGEVVDGSGKGGCVKCAVERG
jgi:hypothetical protein